MRNPAWAIASAMVIEWLLGVGVILGVGARPRQTAPPAIERITFNTQRYNEDCPADVERLAVECAQSDTGLSCDWDNPVLRACVSRR